ncbi:hypothetical protein CF336_g6976 [Tilletia laevis]|nr:hypothetical protein CF336_g6976 [Tilletia laevis]
MHRGPSPGDLPVVATFKHQHWLYSCSSPIAPSARVTPSLAPDVNLTSSLLSPANPASPHSLLRSQRPSRHPDFQHRHIQAATMLSTFGCAQAVAWTSSTATATQHNNSNRFTPVFTGTLSSSNAPYLVLVLGRSVRLVRALAIIKLDAVEIFIVLLLRYHAFFLDFLPDARVNDKLN